MAVANWTGAINSNQTMNAADENYITGNISHTGGTVTIEPGVVMNLSAGVRWTLAGGTINAAGTEAAGIVMRQTPHVGAAYYFYYAWDGVVGAGGPNVWTYTVWDRVVSHAYGVWYLHPAVGADYSTATIDHYLIRGGSSQGGAILRTVSAYSEYVITLTNGVILNPSHDFVNILDTIGADSKITLAGLVLASGAGLPAWPRYNHYGNQNGPLHLSNVLSINGPMLRTIIDSTAFTHGVSATDVNLLGGQGTGTPGAWQFVIGKLDFPIDITRVLISGSAGEGLNFAGYAVGAGTGPTVTIDGLDLYGCTDDGLSLQASTELTAITSDIYTKDNDMMVGVETASNYQAKDLRAIPSPITRRPTPHLPLTVNDGAGGASGTIAVAATGTDTVTVACEMDTGPGGHQLKARYDVQWRENGSGDPWQTLTVGSSPVSWYPDGVQDALLTGDFRAGNGVFATSLSTTINGLSGGVTYDVRVKTSLNETSAIDLVAYSDTGTVTTDAGGAAPLFDGGLN